MDRPDDADEPLRAVPEVAAADNVVALPTRPEADLRVQINRTGDTAEDTNALVAKWLPRLGALVERHELEQRTNAALVADVVTDQAVLADQVEDLDERLAEVEARVDAPAPGRLHRAVAWVAEHPVATGVVAGLGIAVAPTVARAIAGAVANMLSPAQPAARTDVVYVDRPVLVPGATRTEVVTVPASGNDLQVSAAIDNLSARLGRLATVDDVSRVGDQLAQLGYTVEDLAALPRPTQRALPAPPTLSQADVVAAVQPLVAQVESNVVRTVRHGVEALAQQRQQPQPKVVVQAPDHRPALAAIERKVDAVAGRVRKQKPASSTTTTVHHHHHAPKASTPKPKKKRPVARGRSAF